MIQSGVFAPQLRVAKHVDCGVFACCAVDVVVAAVDEEEFRVTLANTGADALTGSRVKQVEK